MVQPANPRRCRQWQPDGCWPRDLFNVVQFLFAVRHAGAACARHSGRVASSLSHGWLWSYTSVGLYETRRTSQGELFELQVCTGRSVQVMATSGELRMEHGRNYGFKSARVCHRIAKVTVSLAQSAPLYESKLLVSCVLLLLYCRRLCSGYLHNSCCWRRSVISGWTARRRSTAVGALDSFVLIHTLTIRRHVGRITLLARPSVRLWVTVCLSVCLFVCLSRMGF